MNERKLERILCRQHNRAVFSPFLKYFNLTEKPHVGTHGDACLLSQPLLLNVHQSAISSSFCLHLLRLELVLHPAGMIMSSGMQAEQR